MQDEGSQLVAIALATAALDGPDGRWLDLAAGPGGKAGLLGALAAERGAAVDAVEVSPHRAELVRRTVAGLPVTVHIADGRDPGLPAGALRPGAAGRAVHRAGRAAAAPRGPLAPRPRRRRRS